MDDSARVAAQLDSGAKQGNNTALADELLTVPRPPEFSDSEAPRNAAILPGRAGLLASVHKHAQMVGIEHATLAACDALYSEGLCFPAASVGAHGAFAMTDHAQISLM